MSAEATFEPLKLCSKAVNDLFNDRRDEIRYRPPPPTTSFHPIWRAQASKTIVATPTTVADRVAALAAVPIAHAPPPFGCWRPRGHLKPPCSAADPPALFQGSQPTGGTAPHAPASALRAQPICRSQETVPGRRCAARRRSRAAPDTAPNGPNYGHLLG